MYVCMYVLRGVRVVPPGSPHGGSVFFPPPSTRGGKKGFAFRKPHRHRCSVEVVQSRHERCHHMWKGQAEITTTGVRREGYGEGEGHVEGEAEAKVKGKR